MASRRSSDCDGLRVGIDVGAETVKVFASRPAGEGPEVVYRIRRPHGKEPARVLAAELSGLPWGDVSRAGVTGRLGGIVGLAPIPLRQALAEGVRARYGTDPLTVISIGSRGFCVLEQRGGGLESFRENSRCSQGTGNFLCQLVRRFSLEVEAASELAAAVTAPEPLSGRCPVILKTDMTHLANKGVDRTRILAGLFDAVVDNVLTLVKPGVSPPRVVLAGGVGVLRRVRETLARRLAEMDMVLLPGSPEDLCLEALGVASLVGGQPPGVPALDTLFRPVEARPLVRVPGLAGALARVRRLAPPAAPDVVPGVAAIVGLDIGSTGSKAVVLDPASGQALWQAYGRTEGDPVGAAQALVRGLLDGPAGACRVTGVGVTGSGREIVGALLTSCFGAGPVFVLNEIAAHAAGACHFEPRVDTIFEIGGQDAKYIRLSEGRVVDCAMNEACSAGTGSFLEEQGCKFAGIDDVAGMGREAMKAGSGISLGQHCSVFMAEIIDEAIARGEDRNGILAGLYDSTIRNYLHRVKGSRSVGSVIFCQGKPFASDALAAAVARQTGSEVTVPADPGTIGAFGIALLAARELRPSDPPLDLRRFLAARVEEKSTFACGATVGCGEPGNRCRIDFIRSVVEGRQQRFAWGGGCSLHDRATRVRKLPDRAPDPFRRREEAVRLLLEGLPPRGRPRMAMTDEFLLKGLFPFFAVYFHGLGFDLAVPAASDGSTLKRGILEANVPFCAPMQMYHGAVSALADLAAERVFLPMIRSLPRVASEDHAVTCPVVQAGPDIVRLDLARRLGTRIFSPVLDFDAAGLRSERFRGACLRMSEELGATRGWAHAFDRAVEAQEGFDARCRAAGREALDFCRQHRLPAVVVLGRPYTLHNTVLNANVPACLREQGAVAIPLDCYPVPEEAGAMAGVYWAHGQRILRVARDVRARPGVYAVYCSNYSCGPDSFLLHLFNFVMTGKPHAVIETDGHAGDAGTKTRLEAFLYCVATDTPDARNRRPAPDFARLSERDDRLFEAKERGDTVLIPWMGPASEVAAACLRAVGVKAEAMPPSSEADLQSGRRHTSGKECLPMTLTLGGLLRRLESDRAPGGRYVLLMPRTYGPCRFGMYGLLHRLVLDRLGFDGRVRILSPVDTDYFRGFPPALSTLFFAGAAAEDALQAALHDTRPLETRAGAADEVYARVHAELIRLLEEAGRGELGGVRAVHEVINGRLFGLRALVARAAAAFAAVRRPGRVPVVLVAGEIYVRLNPFANGEVIRELERRGVGARLAPMSEWLEYSDFASDDPRTRRLGGRLGSLLQRRILDTCHRAARALPGWPPRTPVPRSVEAARGYLRGNLRGEAVLTLGTAAHEWRTGRIDGAVFAGPFECMPNKVAESQGWHLMAREGLPILTLAMNGEPPDSAALDSFAFTVRTGFAKRRGADRPTGHAAGADSSSPRLGS